MHCEPASCATDSRGDGLLGRAFLALCLVCFLNAFIVAPFSFLFPVYVEADLQRLPWFTGSLRGLMLALGGIFAVVGGRLCDLFGRKATLLVGLLGAVLTGLVFRTHDPALLTLLVLGMGMGTGPWSTAGQSYLISSVHARRLGLGGALYFLTNTAGGALGNLATGLIKPHWTFSRLGGSMVLAMGAVWVLAVRLLPGGGGGRVARRADAPVRLALWSAYRPFFTRREVQLLVGLRYLITSFWGMVTLVMPLLIYRVSQQAGIARSESMPTYYGAVSLAVAAAGQLLTGILADRYGRTVPLLCAAAGIAVSAAGLTLFSASLPGLFVLGTALTGTAWAVSTLIPKLINEVAGAQEKSRLVGLGHLVWSLAMLSGSVVGGILIQVSPVLPFAVGAVLATGGTLCGWRLCLLLDRPR